jgi:hypothetical protein
MKSSLKFNENIDNFKRIEALFKLGYISELEYELLKKKMKDEEGKPKKNH